MEYTFSNKISALQPSAIREILKATADPAIIPLAAGNPAPDAFPVDEARAITADILQKTPIDALQYGVSEGISPCGTRCGTGLPVGKRSVPDGDDLLIVSGATQIMDLVMKVLCNEGDTVICEEPSFIGSLNCFRSYGCKLAGVPMEADGMDTAGLGTGVTGEPGRPIYLHHSQFPKPLRRHHEPGETAAGVRPCQAVWCADPGG